MVVDGWELAVDDHGDGTYSYVLPPELAEPADDRRGAVTWTYAGQQSFDFDPEPITHGWDEPNPEEDPELASIEALARSIRIDKFGRRWEAAAVDESVLDQVVSAYEATIEHEPITLAPFASQEPEVGGEVTFFNWNTETCTDDGVDFDYHYWDEDDRNKLTGLNARQKTTVVIAQGAFLWPVCSGVLIDDDWVLTSAHCIGNSGSNPHDPQGYSICTKGVWRYGGQCRSVESFVPHPDWNGTGLARDIGLVELDPASSFDSDVGTMNLSAASDTTLQDIENAHNLAYPRYRDTDPCTVNPVRHFSTNHWGVYMMHMSEEVSRVTNKKIGTRNDGGPGHSGSPIYYCPNNGTHACEVGEPGYVIGVFSGWYNGGVIKYNGGPKVPFYRSWILGVM